jgi:hypothetical protein
VRVRCVHLKKSVFVSEIHVASIIRVKELARQETIRNRKETKHGVIFQKINTALRS